ncbi:MAG: hypothetical protein BWY42_00912 [Candidatus Omnitrophica bacterium ADurb.Bin277]|nr:MAG: hypothetical protein BWY42_00912 [Candidatus Omnitrophica bacterium ADurb.Bin277]
MRPIPRTLIAGAGLAGLSAAWHLGRKNIPSLIFEKENEAGGLCRSKRVRGFTFDQSGHLLHFKTSYARNLVKNLLKGNIFEHERSAWVSIGSRLIRYPFQGNLFGLPPRIVEECLDGLIKVRGEESRRGSGKTVSFSQWIRRTFGQGIARHFMEPYNTKFWTIPTREITCEWTSGMVPVPSLRRMIRGAKKENTEPLGYNARFWYPGQGGIGRLARAFEESLPALCLDARICRIDLGRKEIELSCGRREKFETLISTIPLPEMEKLLSGAIPRAVKEAFRKLRWNSILNLNLGIDTDGAGGSRHWIYFPRTPPVFFRVGFFHNFSPCLVPRGKSSLYAEISYSSAKPVSKNNILTRVISGLRKNGLVSPGTKVISEDINDIRYGYPIYDRNYKKARACILEFLEGQRIFPCGRYGKWEYMSMEDAILDGKKAAEKVSSPGKR